MVQLPAILIDNWHSVAYAGDEQKMKAVTFYMTVWNLGVRIER